MIHNKAKNKTSIKEPGWKMYKLIEQMYPLIRSLTGNGNRETLSIISEIIPLQIKEIPTGTQVFDWQIPSEWNIRDA